MVLPQSIEPRENLFHGNENAVWIGQPPEHFGLPFLREQRAMLALLDHFEHHTGNFVLIVRR